MNDRITWREIACLTAELFFAPVLAFAMLVTVVVFVGWWNHEKYQRPHFELRQQAIQHGYAVDAVSEDGSTFFLWLEPTEGEKVE